MIRPATDPAAECSPVTRRVARASVPGEAAIRISPPRVAAGKTSAAVLDLALSAAADPPSPLLLSKDRAGAGIPGPATGAAPDRAAAPVRARSKTPAGGTHVSTQASSVPSAGQMAIAKAMSEDRGPDSLEAHLRRLMKGLGLWGYHPRRSEKSEKGWPDWAIIGTRIIYRELKTERGKVTDEQEAVGQRITRAGGDWDVWRPRDLLSGRIAEELRAITAGPLGLGGAA